MKNLINIEKIEEVQDAPCKSKDHRPTESQLMGEGLEAGRYLHTCPSCGKKVYWTVQK